MRTFKYRWPTAFGWSLLCHGALLGAVAALFLLFPPPEPNREPIEVDLVADVGGGGGGGGGGGAEAKEEELPKIHEAKATPTLPPPPPQQQDEEAENDVHDIAQKPAETPSPSDTSSSSSSSSDSDSSGSGGGSGTGSGGGNGSGTGTGDGSGTGPGSGSGSGGGNGSGYGSGNGDGSGDGGGGGGETSGPQLLSAPAPAYPESARRAGISGTTVVGMTISTDGSVSSAWVESSSGNSTLDSAAVNAVYGWRFVPAKQNGNAITANSRVPVTFNLH